MNNYLKRTLISACIYFTLITFVYAALIALIYGSTEGGGLLSAVRTVMFFAFSLLFAAAGGILRSEKYRPLRILIHATLTCVGFYLFMIRPAEIHGLPALMGMFIYYAVYIIASFVLYSKRAHDNKKKNEAKEYQSIIGKD